MMRKENNLNLSKSFFLNILLIIYSQLVISCYSIPVTPPENAASIPIGENCFITQNYKNKRIITPEGIINWDDDIVLSTYFRLQQAGKLDLHIKAINVPGESILKVTINDKSVKIKLNPTEKEQIVPIGRFYIKKPGYVKVDLKGIRRTGQTFGDIVALLVSNSATKLGVKYVTNNFPFNWGLMGPKVSINFPFPKNENIEWFYNEITVPSGYETYGASFTINGFKEGYFKMEKNTPTSGTVRFVVLNTFERDDPNEISDKKSIKLIRKGNNVIVFDNIYYGNCYMNFDWKPDTTYRFLTHIYPTKNGSTLYTGYFYDPKKQKWLLLAEFEQPLISTYYKQAYSSLENLSPNLGYLIRHVYYKNQWAYSSQGKWIEMTKAHFYTDEPVRNQVRLDYAGGVIDNQYFYLKTCGFFDDYTAPEEFLERKPLNTSPCIDFNELP